MKRFQRFYALLALLLAVCLMAPTAFGQSLSVGRLDRYGHRPDWRSYSERHGNAEKQWYW